MVMNFLYKQKGIKRCWKEHHVPLSVTIPAMCCPCGFSTTNDPMLLSAIWILVQC